MKDSWVLRAVIMLGVAGFAWGFASTPARAQDAGALVEQAEKDARAKRWNDAIRGYQKAYDLSQDPAYLFNIAQIWLVGAKDPAKAWPFAAKYAELASGAERQDAADLVQKVETQLSRTHGRLTIAAQPATADVYLDRKSPDTRLSRPVVWAAAGTHMVLAEAPGYEPGEVQVSVNAGVRSEVAVTLRARAALLRVESRTPRAAVYLDGPLVGPAPVERSLFPGTHSVRVEATGHRPVEQTVTVGPGETRVIHADLVPETGRGPVAAPVSKPPAEPRKGAPYRTAGWALMGSGLGVGAVGAVMYGLAYKDMKDGNSLDDKGDTSGADAKYDAMKKKAYAAYALWGIGGAALVAGLVTYFAAPSDAPVTLIPAGPGGTGLTLTGRW